jgi:two-component system, LytTR family, response regulator
MQEYAARSAGGSGDAMRVVIVDDEAPARARLRQLLAAHPDVEIAGEASSGPEAMELAAQLSPDLLLLDIQMPGATGIDVAACLPEPRPRIVFCTAFEQHAVDAFELQAVDYLLKPVSRARLAQALERVRGAQPAAGTVSGRASTTVRPTRFLCRNAGHYIAVAETRVLYFSAEDGLTRLVADGAKYWIDPTLNDLEQHVDPGRFFRISRGAMVSLGGVVELHPMPGGSGEVVMKNGDRLEVSRRRYRDFVQALGGL